MLPQHPKCLVAVTALWLCLVWSVYAHAGQVQLTWDPPTNPDGSPLTTLAGYYLYAWPGNATVPQQVDVGDQTTYTLTGLVDGQTYTFAATAYNTAGDESDYSNTITVMLPASPSLVSPPPQATLAASMVTFTWSSGSMPVAEWWLYVGTSAGANDLFDSASLGSDLSTTVSGLPTEGEALFVRLWYRIGDLWQFSDFQYT